MKIFIIFLSLPKVYIQPPLWYTRRAMENPRENPLPLPTIRRYPIFLRAIGEMMDAGEAFISSSVLAERLGLDPVLTRKDLAMAGVPGRPRRGYPAGELRAAINRALGWDSATDAVLVGAGSLGSALLGYAGFKEQNLSIVAAFDANPRLAGSTVHGVKVRPLAEMARLVRRLKVHLAILTVPTAAAQACAATLVEAVSRSSRSPPPPRRRARRRSWMPACAAS